MEAKAIEHMNADHADIVEALAKKFGSLADAKGAKLVAIDADGMDIDVAGKMVRVPFAGKANQNGEGYRHAIMELCKDLEPSSEKLAKVSAALVEFIDAKSSVVISSLRKGTPFSSYAPFVRKGDEILILISQVAPHYENLKSNPDKISLFFIQDENEAATVFARVRATFEAKADFSNDQELRNYAFDELCKRFPDDKSPSYIRQMQDFEVVKLKLGAVRFVRGFGAAYDGVGFNILSQAGSANPHKMAHKHG